MENSPDPKPEEVNRIYLPMIVILVGLILWGGFLALGAYLGIPDQVPNHDPRRAWIMLLCSGSFVSFWLLALLWRKRRLRRSARKGRE